ncbi:hypothetical protein AB0I28_29360 [Phytomonospora sp. NPDC050363]|uniref:hypothetical protein n=1 Tax=Phytomonospora sp. NPDC050363 TaxID=3155642 RepID=UPI003402FFD8
MSNSEQMKALGRLVGTWEVTGGAKGTCRWEYIEGEHFLVQHVDLVSPEGATVRGLELIGHNKPFMQERGEDVVSRMYSNDGDTLDYVYDLEGDTLTIWGGERNSPAYYRGVFSADGDTVTGSWVWPGGGYESSMTRVKK